MLMPVVIAGTSIASGANATPIASALRDRTIRTIPITARIEKRQRRLEEKDDREVVPPAVTAKFAEEKSAVSADRMAMHLVQTGEKIAARGSGIAWRCVATRRAPARGAAGERRPRNGRRVGLLSPVRPASGDGYPAAFAQSTSRRRVPDRRRDAGVLVVALHQVEAHPVVAWDRRVRGRRVRREIRWEDFEPRLVQRAEGELVASPDHDEREQHAGGDLQTRRIGTAEPAAAAIRCATTSTAAPIGKKTMNENFDSNPRPQAKASSRALRHDGSSSHRAKRNSAKATVAAAAMSVVVSAGVAEDGGRAPKSARETVPRFAEKTARPESDRGQREKEKRQIAGRAPARSRW